MTLYIKLPDPSSETGSNIELVAYPEDISDYQPQASVTPTASPSVKQVAPNGKRYVVVRSPKPFTLSPVPGDYRVVNFLVPEDHTYIPSSAAFYGMIQQFQGLPDWDPSVWPSYTPPT